MNYIGIMLDSFRQDHLSTYNGGRPIYPGVDACQTPNLDAFADECVVFENAYPGELYNLIDDPRERHNLVDVHPGEAQRLARAFGDIYRNGVPQAEVKGIQGKYELASSGLA